MTGPGAAHAAGPGLRRLSARFWLARQLVMGLTAVPLCTAAVVAAVALHTPAAWGIPAGAVVLVTVAWAVEFGRYRAWGYVERHDDLIVGRGLMFRRLSVVPYGRMQFIDVTAGPVDRLLGLATVQLHTAAAASDARIPGLLRRDAEALRDRLAALGEANATGL
jgi:membrane protein YdbS with pleckstrin-like domain